MGWERRWPFGSRPLPLLPICKALSSWAGQSFPADIQFKGLPGAPQIATLFGDPAKPGMFVQRVKFPAGIKIMPHFHPDEPRTIAVLSGTLYFGLGDTWDESKLQAFCQAT